MKTPEIRINLAWLLLYGESQQLAGDYKLEGYEQFEEWTKNYRAAWRKHESKIVTALQECLGVNFYRSVIDVSCAPFFVCKSEPLIMNFTNEPDQFVDVLTHELCHVLLTDNNVVQLNNDKNKINLSEKWQKLFGKDHDFDTLVHIPVQALCKHIYLDVLKQSERLERDIESVKTIGENTKSYVAAWEYVNDNDYMQIITDLKKSYAEMAK